MTRRHFHRPEPGTVYVTDIAPWDHPTAIESRLTVQGVTARFVTFRRVVAFAGRPAQVETVRESLSGWAQVAGCYRVEAAADAVPAASGWAPDPDAAVPF